MFGIIPNYKNYSKAIELLNAALENFHSLELHQNAVNVSINLSQIYLELNDFDKALQVIDTAITFLSIGLFMFRPGLEPTVLTFQKL